MRHDYPAFVQRQSEVLAIGPDGPAAFADYWAREALPFIGLSDPRHEVADLYGQEVRLLKLGRMPALFVVDRQGRLRYQHYARSMRDIPPNETILALLDDLNRAADAETLSAPRRDR